MINKPKEIKCKCGNTFRAIYDYRTGIIKNKLCPSCTYKKKLEKAKEVVGLKCPKGSDKRKKRLPKPFRMKESEVFDNKDNVTPKAIKYYSTTSTKTLKQDAIKYFNRFIKLRDTDKYGYGKCISSGQDLMYQCGVKYINNELAQAGHFIARGACSALAFDEDNVHLQGKSDNYFKSGNENFYRPALIQKIGENRVARLDRIAATTKKIGYKMTTYEKRYLYIRIKHKYMAKSRELLKTKVYHQNKYKN